MAENSTNEDDVEGNVEQVEEEVICEENEVNIDDAKKYKSQVGNSLLRKAKGASRAAFIMLR